MRLDQITARPRAMLSMASVVTKDGTRKRSETQPFNQPMARPMAEDEADGRVGRHQVAHQQEGAPRWPSQGHDGADRQVDASDDDDQQHAHGQDAGLGDVPRDVAQVALAQEQVRVVADGREDDRQHDDDDQPEEALEAEDGAARPGWPADRLSTPPMRWRRRSSGPDVAGRCVRGAWRPRRRSAAGAGSRRRSRRSRSRRPCTA